MIKIHRSNHRIRPFSSQTHGERLRQSVVESRRNRPTLRKWSLEIEKVGSMSVRCAPSPLRTATAGGARSMPTIHILSPIVDNLSTFYPHSIHILSTFYPHSIHISYRARGMPCATQGGTGLARQREGWVSPSLCLLPVCVMLVGGNRGACCWACACTCLWGVACAFHGPWMVVQACARPALIGVCWWLWWLVVVFCSGCCCLCDSPAHGLEKIFVEPVALWISTLYLC